MRHLYDHRIYATILFWKKKKTIISSLFQSFQNQLPNKKANEKLEKTKVQWNWHQINHHLLPLCFHLFSLAHLQYLFHLHSILNARHLFHMSKVTELGQDAMEVAEMVISKKQTLVNKRVWKEHPPHMSVKTSL